MYMMNFYSSGNKHIKEVNFYEIMATKEYIRIPKQQHVHLKDIKKGDVLKVIASLRERSKKGQWYDFIPKFVKLKPRPLLVGNIIYGRDRNVKENCTVITTGTIFRITGTGKSGIYFSTKNFQLFRFVYCTRCSTVVILCSFWFTYSKGTIILFLVIDITQVPTRCIRQHV